MPLRIVLLGTRGVPARYGGFETAVEEIGSRLAASGHEVVVYCRNKGQHSREYRDMTLVNLPALQRRSLETLSHTALSVGHCLATRRPDVAFVFNAANAPLVAPLKIMNVPVAIHIDGLEWRRAKWGGIGRQYYRRAEGLSVRIADAIIADARGLQDYLRTTYGATSWYIPYGAPIISPGTARLSELGLSSRSYHLVVARLEPENHVDMIIRGYLQSSARHPLVVVGGTPYDTPYSRSISALAASDTRVRLLGSVWDQELLDQLYSGALSYLHGHSVGGTNPSLLRALGAGAPVTAFDVVFNREVTGGNARLFRDEASLARAIEHDQEDVALTVQRGRTGQTHAAQTYSWDDVATSYAHLAVALTQKVPLRRA